MTRHDLILLLAGVGFGVLWSTLGYWLMGGWRRP